MIDKESVVRTEHDFLQWLSGAVFYVGRCCSLAGIGSSKTWIILVCQATGNDTSPVGKKQIWYTEHDDPSVAMTDVVGQLRRFYFDVLNRSGE